jgi:hypothetical protein
VCRHIEEIPKATQNELLWSQLHKLMAQAARRRDEYLMTQWPSAPQAQELTHRPPMPSTSILSSQAPFTNAIGTSRPHSYPELHALSPVAATALTHTASRVPRTNPFFDGLVTPAMSVGTLPIPSGSYNQLPGTDDQSWLFSESGGGGGWVTQWPQEIPMDLEQWNRLSHDAEQSAHWRPAAPR